MYEKINRAPDRVFIDDAGATQNGSVFCVENVRVATEIEGNRVRVTLCADGVSVKRIRLRWIFAHKVKGLVLGDAWERSYADLQWNSIQPWKMHPWYVLLNEGEITAGYGVMVRSGAICSWTLDPHGVTLWLDVRSGGQGVALHGRTLEAAVVVSDVFDGINAFHATRAFCKQMCTDGIFPKEPVYGSNNWYYAYGKSSFEEMLAEADYITKLTAGTANQPYVVVDDGWQMGRYDDNDECKDDYIGGPWIPNHHFRDMAALAEGIRSRGARAGIWIRPLQDDLSPLPDEWYIPNNHMLDPSVPAVLEHVKSIVRQIGQWGFRLLKHDFSTFDITGRWGSTMTFDMVQDGWTLHDRTRTTAEIIIGLYQAIHEAAAEFGMLVMGCNAVGHLGAGLMELNRIGDDTSGLHWERTQRYGVNTLAFRMAQHNIFYAIDADCIGITPYIPWEKNRQWGTLLAKSGTPFFVSVKPASLSAEQEQALSEMLKQASVAHTLAQPLDWTETPLPEEWELDGERVCFDWYAPQGLEIPVKNGLYWNDMWQDIRKRLEWVNA